MSMSNVVSEKCEGSWYLHGGDRKGKWWFCSELRDNGSSVVF